MVDCNFKVNNACSIQEWNTCDGDKCIFQKILKHLEEIKVKEK